MHEDSSSKKYFWNNVIFSFSLSHNSYSWPIQLSDICVWIGGQYEINQNSDLWSKFLGLIHCRHHQHDRCIMIIYTWQDWFCKAFLNWVNVWFLSSKWFVLIQFFALCSYYGSISAYLLILKSLSFLTEGMIVVRWLGTEKTVF